MFNFVWSRKNYKSMQVFRSNDCPLTDVELPVSLVGRLTTGQSPRVGVLFVPADDDDDDDTYPFAQFTCPQNSNNKKQWASPKYATQKQEEFLRLLVSSVCRFLFVTTARNWPVSSCWNVSPLSLPFVSFSRVVVVVFTRHWTLFMLIKKSLICIWNFNFYSFGASFTYRQQLEARGGHWTCILPTLLRGKQLQGGSRRGFNFQLNAQTCCKQNIVPEWIVVENYTEVIVCINYHNTSTVASYPCPLAWYRFLAYQWTHLKDINEFCIWFTEFDCHLSSATWSSFVNQHSLVQLFNKRKSGPVRLFMYVLSTFNKFSGCLMILKRRHLTFVAGSLVWFLDHTRRHICNSYSSW